VLWIEQGAQLRIPGPFEPAQVQAVVLQARLKGKHHLNVQLGAELVAFADFVGDGVELQELRFDYRGVRRRSEPIEQVTVSVRGPSFGLEAVELVDVPLEQLLPAAGQPQLVNVDGDARRGVGLRRGRALDADLEVRSGDVLRFSLGRPYEVAGPGGGSSWVRVTAHGDAAAGFDHRLDLLALDDGSVPWQEVRLPLEQLAGRSLRVRFELEGDPQGPAVAALADVFVEGAAAATAPTVLLITSDTHRGDHLGLTGAQPGLSTPTLDALAARGVSFEDCWATSSFTSPSHVAIMTGLHPRDTGVVRNSGSKMTATAHTLAEAFAEEGFATYAVVTFYHLGPYGTGLGQGFDRMAWCEDDSWDAEHPISLLESWLPQADGRPLFAWLHVADAHWPYEPPPAFDRLYYAADKDPFDPALPAPELPAGSTVPPEFAALRDLEYPRAQYRAEVSYLDRELGGLLEHPRLREALVAFTSDHGEVLADHGSLFMHVEVWPDTLHVPLILAGPGVPDGERIDRPVVQTDIARTLLDLAGLRDTPFPGRDLLEGPARPGAQDEPRFAIGPYASTASIAWGQWFLLMALREEPPSEALRLERHGVLLFDLSSDPGCRHDVAEAQRDVARRLREALVRWLASPQGENLSETLPQDDEALAQLAALGYTSELVAIESRAWIDPDCDCDRCRAWR
jgi:arylsulfatase A-like enzyme